MSIRPTRATSIRQPRETVTVDYADVLRQAVDNERWRVLREVRRRVETVAETVPKSSYEGYGSEDRAASVAKKEILEFLDRIEAGDV